MKLSGGEKQRVGIARTLLKIRPSSSWMKPPAPLTAKPNTKSRIALERAGRGRTVITIAHRLSTVLNADRIVVLENGAVVESGTHDDLLKRKGVILISGRCKAPNRRPRAHAGA